jgi:hypothetical protein
VVNANAIGINDAVVAVVFTFAFIPPVLNPPVYLQQQPVISESSVEQETGRFYEGKMIYEKTIYMTSTAYSTVGSWMAIGSKSTLLPDAARIIDTVTIKNKTDGSVYPIAGKVDATNVYINAWVVFMAGNPHEYTFRYIKN